MTKHSAGHSKNRLLELSNEVSRIAASLAELSLRPGSPDHVGSADDDHSAADIPAELVSWVISARRNRANYFASSLFADPAWDMLLDLLEAEIRGRHVSVSSLCIAAAVPASTALRWINAMVREGLFVRRPDPDDLRRVYIVLSPQASAAMRRYFAALNLGA